MFVKICGITNEEDALLAVAMGADALGFVFAPSTRQVTPQQARDIVRRLPGGILSVGVFRNELRNRVVDVVHEVGLSAAQLHGHESAEDSAWVADHVPSVIKALVAGSPAIDRVPEYKASAVLIEGPTPGSGEVFDWSMLDGANRGFALLLAGGLDPDNVAQAIRQVRPWGVDVSSGVEASPGRKDPAKVRNFINNAKAAAPEPAEDDELLHGDSASFLYDWREE
ncbi:MAG: phosphoribosylanthranilate isomerase [Candidatus Poriferisodalaceae bacterium]|jgi:phosphoribosylanthranilate isomerase